MADNKSSLMDTYKSLQAGSAAPAAQGSGLMATYQAMQQPAKPETPANPLVFAPPAVQPAVSAEQAQQVMQTPALPAGSLIQAALKQQAFEQERAKIAQKEALPSISPAPAYTPTHVDELLKLETITGAEYKAAKDAEEHETQRRRLQGLSFSDEATRQIAHGLQNTLPGLAADSIVSRIIGQPVPEIGESGPLSIAIQFSDPIVSKFFKFASKVGGDRVAQATGLLRQEQRLNNVQRMARSGTALGLEVAKKESEVVLRQLAVNKIKQEAVRMGAGSGAAAGAFEAGRQLRDDGEIDPLRLGLATASGALIGAAIPVASGPLAAKKEKLRLQPGILKSNISPDKQRDVFDAIYKDVASKVDDTIAHDPSLAPHRTELIMSQWAEELDQYGIKLAPKTYRDSTGQEFLTSMTKFSNIDRKVGSKSLPVMFEMMQGENIVPRIEAETQKAFILPIRKLNKLGMSPPRITRALRYVETDPATGQQFFNVQAIPEGGSRRAFWQGAVPSQEQQLQLFQLRKAFDEAALKQPEIASKLNYRQGYVPLIPKDIFRNPQASKAMDSLAEPALLHRRGEQGFNGDFHEDDINVLARYYSRAVAKHVAFGKTIPKLRDEITKLQLLGEQDAAEALWSAATRSLGMRQKSQLPETITSEFLETNRNLINRAALEQGIDPANIWQDLGRLTKNQLYNTLYLANPMSHIKNAAQLTLVGAGEIGLANSELGRAMLLKRLATSAGRAELRDIAQYIVPTKNALRDAGETEIRNKAVRAANWLGDKTNATFITRPLNDAIEYTNRLSAYLGAKAQLDRALKSGGQAGTSSVLEGLLPGERQLVLDKLKDEGAEAAARAYGIIRSNRINLIYGMGDKPEIFTGKLGKYTIFTTWTTTQTMRALEPFMGGSKKALAARIIKPLVMLSALQKLTGHNVPGAHPFDISPEINAFPLASEVGGTLRRVGPGAAARKAAEMLTVAGPIKRNIKRLERAETPLEALGFKQVE
jgi:hypothetical protein